uniref:Uncharacterized protein n=1 Tax=Vibrio phage Vc1 TaxID=1480731 RepID=A0A6M5CCV4_9CAUD
MTVKTLHHDTHGDTIAIYRGETSNLVFIDGLFDDSDVAFRGIYRAQDARAIAKRLNDPADIIEGK